MSKHYKPMKHPNSTNVILYMTVLQKRGTSIKMENLKLINEYGVLGFIVAIGFVFWRTKLIEYFFYNDYDRMFWSSSRKGIHKMINSIMIAFLIFIMIISFGLQVVDLPKLSIIIIYLVSAFFLITFIYSVICNKFKFKFWIFKPITDELINVVAGLIVSFSIVISYWLYNYDFSSIILNGQNEESRVGLIVVNALFSSLVLSKLLILMAEFANQFRDILYLVKENDKYILVSVADNEFFILKKVNSFKSVIVKRDNLDEYELVRGPSNIG